MTTNPGPPQPLVALIGVRPARVLADTYAQPLRHYHTIGHAQVVATHVEELGASRAALLAAWFHDAIYDPRSTTNEADSADLLRSELPDDPDTPRAAALVDMTAQHDPDPDDRDACVLSDADMAVLGSSPDAYETYRQAVRREYAHVADPDWVAGRGAFLQGLLAQPAIFRTPQGHARWEAAARSNLADEVDGLLGG